MSVAHPSINLSPPEPDTWGRPVGMALVVHAALVVALAWGVGWQKDSMVVFEAEVWSALPQVAAPRAVAPEPAPVEPVVEAPPPPPEPAPAPPPPAPPPPQAKAPQVVTQKTPPKPEPKPEPRPPAKQAAEPDRAQQQQAQRDAERAAREREAQRRAEQQRQAQQRERERQAQLEAERQRNIERMLGQANATGSSSATGQAAQSSGPSASYAGRLVATIRPNIVFTDVVAGNPRAEVELRAGPDGTILSSRLRQSSGSAAWDQAVLRAIERTGKLPLDENGRVPSSLILGFRPQD
jgi:colicin import membrane protein